MDFRLILEGWVVGFEPTTLSLRRGSSTNTSWKSNKTV
nr:MAG TPA: hypothetical protein [Caudoviricetes sp.]